jgi:hypothetical protein
MKKSLLILTVVLGLVAVAAAAFAANPKPVFTVGQEVYACNCGVECPCNTIANKPGKCVCGKEMVKAKVVKVEKGKVMLLAEGWEKPRPFKTTPKYVCACGPECNCNAISQKPGKCPCGTEMKKAK